MQTRHYIEANRIAWDEIAPRHREQNFNTLSARVARQTSSCLDVQAEALLERLPLTNKNIAHLCCNNGRELLTLKKRGAGRCVGFDISKEFVAQAKELSLIGQADCEFIATDIYRISPEFDVAFDIVLVTIGSLGWLPDIKGFFATVARLLKHGGLLTMHEQHPIMDMFNLQNSGDLLKIRYSYFKKDPFIEENGLDYYGDRTFSTKRQYWFHHTMADIITSCIHSGLTLRELHEYPMYAGNVLAHFERLACQLPLSYTLLAQKH